MGMSLIVCITGELFAYKQKLHISHNEGPLVYTSQD